MIIFKTEELLKKYFSNKVGLVVGFVPTMGALHQGHISLIRKSKSNADITVCSIFVNQTQFNDKADFEKYPKTIEQDIFLLENSGCDILFLPSVNEIYSNGKLSTKEFQLGLVEIVFEGVFRPGHFNGVCTVVERLLQIVLPNKMFLGQKDFQQCMVLKKLISQKKINTEIVICDTTREKNGLAMSSRNNRLSDDMREKAGIIYDCFIDIKEKINSKNCSNIIQESKMKLLENGFSKIDYLSLANVETLAPIYDWNGETKIVILIAAFTENVRLIDNMILN